MAADQQNKMRSFSRMWLDMSRVCRLRAIEMLDIRSIIYVLPRDPKDFSIRAFFSPEITFCDFF